VADSVAGRVRVGAVNDHLYRRRVSRREIPIKAARDDHDRPSPPGHHQLIDLFQALWPGHQAQRIRACQLGNVPA